MALAAIRTDLITSVRYSDQTFGLMSRQEVSRQANGRSRGKDLGPAIWIAEWTTVALDFDRALAFEADLNSLDGVIGRFYGHDLRRPFPMAYPKGDFADSGRINTLGSNNKSMSLKGLPAGFKLSKGDRLAFDYVDAGGDTERALHEVSESVVANGSGVTPVFEVRPFIRLGAAANLAVTLKRPSGLFTLAEVAPPARVEGTLFCRLSFRAAQF